MIGGQVYRINQRATTRRAFMAGLSIGMSPSYDPDKSEAEWERYLSYLDDLAPEYASDTERHDEALDAAFATRVKQAGVISG